MGVRAGRAKTYRVLTAKSSQDCTISATQFLAFRIDRRIRPRTFNNSGVTAATKAFAKILSSKDRLLRLAEIVPRLAAFLFQQPYVRYAHAAVDRFAHVVNREQAHADRGQGFHFYAGAAQGFHADRKHDAAA